MKQAGRIIGHVEQTAIQDRLLRLALGAQVNMRDSGVDLLAVTAGEDHMPFRLDLVGRSIGTEGDRRLIGGAVTVGIVGYVLKQIEQPAGAIELRVMGTDGQRLSSYAGIESNVGGQDDDSRLRVKAGAGRAARGLGQPELDPFRGAGKPGLLVEHQARGLDVYRTPAFAIVRRGLAGLGARSGGSLKIDLDFAHGAGNAMDRIPIEGAAIDAVGRCSLGAIQGDAHVVQLGVAVTLVLHRLGGVQGVDGVTATGLRIGKAFGGLLDTRSLIPRANHGPDGGPAIAHRQKRRQSRRPGPRRVRGSRCASWPVSGP